MEQGFGYEGGDNRQQQILREAEARYGSDAHFVYVRPAEKQLVAMTLEQAMQICGQHMAQEDSSVLWATLDKWHDMAKRLESKSNAMFEKSLELGRSALLSRGLTVGETGGATS